MIRKHFLILSILGLINLGGLHGQEVKITIGIEDSIESVILNEIRPIIVTLPSEYHNNNRSYPVLFVLDGSELNSLQARLVLRELNLEMITVSIANTNRNRDMMPLSRPSYEVDHPEAEKFLAFIEKELIPHVNEKYRTNENRTLRGRSLSGLFTMYAFLTNPKLFDNYIGNCAGWFADMDEYFNELADDAFKNKEAFEGKSLFVANSLADPLDPNQEIHQSMVDLSQRIKTELGNRIKFKYLTYEEGGHVPYSSFYDGMKYIFIVK